MTLATPPVAAKKPATLSHHGHELADDYAWLRDPGYPEVKDPAILAHLEAENAWFEARMAPHKPLVDRLFKEMRARIKEADKSVPQKDGDWLYWIEFEEGAEYKKWWRKPVAGGPDELILDDAPRGLRLLYIALTRPTQHLTVVHARPLPAGLAARA